MRPKSLLNAGAPGDQMRGAPRQPARNIVLAAIHRRERHLSTSHATALGGLLPSAHLPEAWRLRASAPSGRVAALRQVGTYGRQACPGHPNEVEGRAFVPAARPEIVFASPPDSFSAVFWT